MITFIIFIALFTVIYGRLFCGWVCPQTVFMEMVFRKIEWWIEGSPNQQKKNRSEEHTSELQSQSNIVCRLLLEKKNKIVSTSLILLILLPTPRVHARLARRVRLIALSRPFPHVGLIIVNSPDTLTTPHEAVLCI